MTRKAIFILALSLFAFSQGQTECDENQCLDLWTAKKCDKVSYCIEKDWVHRKPLNNSDSICNICLRMVKEARETLRSNETREELLQVFEGSCSLLTFKPAVKICDELSKEFVYELVEILSSRMDPETVCTVAKLCNNEAFATALKNSKSCIYCESFTENALRQMELISENQFKNEFYKRCRTTGSYTDACTYIASIYSDYLYDVTRTVLLKQPCQAFSLCPSGSLHPESIVKVKKNMCPLCKTVMTNLEQQLLNVKSPKEFSQVLFGVCTKFEFSPKLCLEISNSGLYEKFKKEKEGLHFLCRMAFCGEKHSGELDYVQNLVPSGEAFSSTKNLDFMEFYESLELFFPKEVEENVETNAATVRPTIAYGDPVDTLILPRMLTLPTFDNCSFCIDVVTRVENNGFAKSLNENNINTVCESMANEKGCKDFLNNYSTFLVKAFDVGSSPENICEDLMWTCASRAGQLTEEISTPENCDICLISMKLFKKFNLGLNDVSDEKCNVFPKNSRKICNYVFSSLSWIFKKVGETDICHPICSSVISAGKAVQKQYLSAKSVIVTCDNCVSTLTKVKQLSRHKVLARLMLRSFCRMLPLHEAFMCRKIIRLIPINKIAGYMGSINPTGTCEKYYICGSNSTTYIAERRKIPCRFCLMAIRTLMDELQNQKTEEAIRKALEGLCSYFPEETRDTCRNLIDQYAEDIIDMIIADFNATEICAYLKICPEQLLSSSYSSEIPLISDKNKTEKIFDIKTNQIYDEKPVVRAEEEESSARSLELLHVYVKECALCEALVGVINSHNNMLRKDYDFSANADRICSIVPENDEEKCKSLLISYGPSIVNLIVDKKVNINDVCVYVDLCDPKMQAKVNLPVSVSEDKYMEEKNDCTQGPKFWCANAENAEKCGTFLHCQETVWKNWKNPPKRPN